MVNNPNWRPTQGVSHGEQSHQALFLEGPIYWRVSADAEWVKLTLVDDGTNSGIYVFRNDTQSADNVLPS